MIGKEQGALKSGRGCVDQIFILKQRSEKMKEWQETLFGFHGFATRVW